MHTYRPLLPIKAFTFDLDDTLYDNQQVIERTENEVINFLHKHYPELMQIDLDGFRQFRIELLNIEPEIYHDVTYWRWRSIYLLLLGNGYSVTGAEHGATETMTHFAYWRNQIVVPSTTHSTLARLAEIYPLAVITNGNAQIDKFGLDGYFQFVLSSGKDGRAKPYQDMFIKAAELLDIAPENIMHVGDDLTTDITGALNNNFQSCWINDRKRILEKETESSLFPHIEISCLDSLLVLL